VNSTHDVLISLQDIHVFRGETIILDGIDWRVKNGEQWVVLGANGSGKSFLMSIVSSLLHPSGGQVTVFGRELGQVNVWDLRSHIGVVSDRLQSEYTGGVRVLDVVCSGFFSSVGLYREVEEWMEERGLEILSRLNIEHLYQRPYGNLSHGEQKRVLIARALVFYPELLILDEPCNGLDIPSREYFLRTLSDLASSGTHIVYVTHHVDEIMPFVTHVLLLRDGRVASKGKKVDVLREDILNDGLGYEMRLLKEEGRYFSVYRGIKKSY
jgi:iron complex transport system ATP-binding protein